MTTESRLPVGKRSLEGSPPTSIVQHHRAAVRFARPPHGHPTVRAALYMAALVASRANSVIAAYYTKLRATGKTGKQSLVACMRRLVVILNPSSETVSHGTSLDITDSR